MKNKKRRRRFLHYRSTFFLPRNGNQDDLAVTFEVATRRHLACSSAAVIGTQIHNAVLLARVSPRLLISSRLQQQLTTLLAVVCVCCSTKTKATDRRTRIVYTSYSPSTSPVICYAACFLVSPSPL